jgi:hypothetical protein
MGLGVMLLLLLYIMHTNIERGGISKGVNGGELVCKRDSKSRLDNQQSVSESKFQEEQMHSAHTFFFFFAVNFKLTLAFMKYEQK